MNPNQFEEKRYTALLRQAAEAQLADTPETEAAPRSAEELLHELRVHQIELEMQNEELRRAHVAMEESRDRYADLYDFAPVGYLTLSREGMIAEINLMGATFLGMERKKLLRSRLDTFVAPEDRDRWHQQFINMIKHEIGRQQFELQLKRSDGSLFYGRLDCLRIASRDEAPVIRIALTNIDELKHTENLLRASNERISDLLNASNERIGLLLASTGEGIYAVDENGLCTIANPACAKLLGYATPDKLLGRDMHRLMHYRREDGSDYPLAACPVHAVIRTAQPTHQREERFWRADGSSFPVEIFAYPMHRDGVVVGVVVSFDDITERKRGEALLSESEEKFRVIFEAALDGIALVDAATNRLAAGNPALSLMLGYRPEELTRLDISDVHPPQDLPHAIEQFDRQLRGEIQFAADIPVKRKDGSVFFADIKSARVNFGGKNYLVGIFHDVTAHKQAEEKLRLLNETLELRVQKELDKNREKDLLLNQQSRRASIGEVIHNVAHHWRQPLSAVSLLLANIKDSYEFNELTQEFLDREVAEGQRLIYRMSETIDRFRGFFTHDGEKQSFRVCDKVDETIELLAPAFKSCNIEIKFERCREAHSIFGYPDEFAQALVNILSNAKDAIVDQSRGAQRPATSCQTREIAGKVHITVDKKGSSITVAIRNNGGNIPEEILDKVFIPYFTTREGGTGLGLYLSKAIMDNMGGAIALHNVGDGAEVLLALPLEEPELAISAELT